MLLVSKGDLTAAYPLLTEAHDGKLETLGNRHPDTIIANSRLVAVLDRLIDAPPERHL